MNAEPVYTLEELRSLSRLRNNLVQAVLMFWSRHHKPMFYGELSSRYSKPLSRLGMRMPDLLDSDYVSAHVTTILVPGSKASRREALIPKRIWDAFTIEERAAIETTKPEGRHGYSRQPKPPPPTYLSPVPAVTMDSIDDIE